MDGAALGHAGGLSWNGWPTCGEARWSPGWMRRGADRWRGPVMAAAVIFPAELSGAEPWLAAIDDSKRLSEKRRGGGAWKSSGGTLWRVAVAQQDADDIDALGILPATIQAMDQRPAQPAGGAGVCPL